MRRTQFRLRMLLLLVALVAVGPAWTRPKVEHDVRCAECREYVKRLECIRKLYQSGFQGCIWPVTSDHGEFLDRAVVGMRKYRRQRGEFPKQWHQIRFRFVADLGTAFRLDDPRIYPAEDDGNRWRPIHSNTTYVIASAGRDRFVMRAVDQDGDDLHLVDQDTIRPSDGIWP
jgi:hypothetical protein